MRWNPDHLMSSEMAYMNFRRRKIHPEDPPFMPTQEDIRMRLVPRMCSPGALIMVYGEVRPTFLFDENIPALFVHGEATKKHHGLLSKASENTFCFVNVFDKESYFGSFCGFFWQFLVPGFSLTTSWQRSTRTSFWL